LFLRTKIDYFFIYIYQETRWCLAPSSRLARPYFYARSKVGTSRDYQILIRLSGLSL